MKPPIFTCLLAALVTCSAWSQSAVRYSYDAAGNRTARSIYLQQKKAPAVRITDTTSMAATVHSDQLSGATITIYPNPTMGLLQVKLSQWPAQTTWLKVYDVAGKEVITIPQVDLSTTVDLGQLHNGLYLLHLGAGDQVREWKVVKE